MDPWVAWFDIKGDITLFCKLGLYNQDSRYGSGLRDPWGAVLST